MIAVIDYDMGNVGSILNMLRKIGATAKLTSDHTEIRDATALILPGVGAFDQGMRNLAAKDLRGLLDECVLARGTPLLGICLGMQLLTKGSEEGTTPGFGWIDAETKRFCSTGAEAKLRIPHMGWNYVQIPVRTRPPGGTLADRLFMDGEPNPKFYFVHSYHACCARTEDVLATANYGYEFSAAIGRENVAGTQFHPEKSLRFGLALMHSFVKSVTAVHSRT
ncbi:MAG: imidazole glycerol phosphate synthase subunit HisH [Opitutae bacterium]|nr:imidazole glycerol phosphate synthase subunit HisH [Opitutae bacterium]